MGDKRKTCGSNHRFREHNIGAGLTRKICVECGVLQIGQGRRVDLTQDPWHGKALSLFVRAS